MNGRARGILILALLLLASDVALSALNVNGLDIYVSVFAMAYLAYSFVFRPRREKTDFLGIALAAVFILIILLRVAGGLIG